MNVEALGDRHYALAVRSGGSNSVYVAVCQRCSSSSPGVRDGVRLVLDGPLWEHAIWLDELCSCSASSPSSAVPAGVRGLQNRWDSIIALRTILQGIALVGLSVMLILI